MNLSIMWLWNRTLAFRFLLGCCSIAFVLSSSCSTTNNTNSNTNSENKERSDSRCGPKFGEAKCGTNRCCSSSNYCGNLNEPHCGALNGYKGKYDGPRS